MMLPRPPFGDPSGWSFTGGEYSAFRSTASYTCWPIGDRSSSAMCPSRPAERATRETPRVRCGGMPMSASAAPQTPAPLTGSRRPRNFRCIRSMASRSRRLFPSTPASAAILDSTGVRGSPSLCTGWPSPGTNRLCSTRVRINWVSRFRPERDDRLLHAGDPRALQLGERGGRRTRDASTGRVNRSSRRTRGCRG
jgi:hypothetical protein